MIDTFISKWFRSKDPIIIEPYGGFANDTHIFSKARILEDEGIQHDEDDGIFKNIWNTYKRLESDEIADSLVTIEWGRESIALSSDEEGYVEIKVKHGFEDLQKHSKWLPLSLRLEHSQHRFVTSTEILFPGKDVEYGIISDLDDTVIETGVSSTFKWRLLINSISKHAHKRRPLEGVQEFYQALCKGKELFSSNPIFYVSNSPWNLYEYLSSFLTHNNFPKGPVILRDLSISIGKDKGLENSAKYKTIAQILAAYPAMKFVLIGDSAEVDTDIYLNLAKRFPEQVHSIFIRTIKNKKRMSRVKKLIESQEEVNVKLIEDSAQAMSYAKELGLI